MLDRASSWTTGRPPRRASGGSAVRGFELVLHEGRKHQVKRMCEAVGHPVRRLHRPRYAGLGLTGLNPGQWRDLTGKEVASLRKLKAR